VRLCEDEKSNVTQTHARRERERERESERERKQESKTARERGREIDRVLQFSEHIKANGIELFGTIQSDRGDAIRH